MWIQLSLQSPASISVFVSVRWSCTVSWEESVVLTVLHRKVKTPSVKMKWKLEARTNCLTISPFPRALVFMTESSKPFYHKPLNSTLFCSLTFEKKAWQHTVFIVVIHSALVPWPNEHFFTHMKWKMTLALKIILVCIQTMHLSWLTKRDISKEDQ